MLTVCVNSLQRKELDDTKKSHGSWCVDSFEILSHSHFLTIFNGISFVLISLTVGTKILLEIVKY